MALMNKTISLYFSGTGFFIGASSFLTGYLYSNTEENETQIKMGFNGCGVDYGFTGTIFGSGLLYATGGLAAIPFLAPIVLKLGALSLLAVSPLIGAALAIVWHGAAKPILSWCANKLFYPYYSMRTIAPQK